MEIKNSELRISFSALSLLVNEFNRLGVLLEKNTKYEILTTKEDHRIALRLRTSNKKRKGLKLEFTMEGK